MAGACFSLVYQAFGPSEWTALGAWISATVGRPLASTPQLFEFGLDATVVPRISRAKDEPPPKQASQYFVSLKDVLPYPRADHAAIQKSLGYVPTKELTACAAFRGAFNIDGLLFLQKAIIERFGGWFAFEGDRLPADAASLAASANRGLVVVNVADYAGYFGPGPIDPDYAAQYEAFVPKKTLYFVDARLTGFRHLDV